MTTACRGQMAAAAVAPAAVDDDDVIAATAGILAALTGAAAAVAGEGSGGGGALGWLRGIFAGRGAATTAAAPVVDTGLRAGIGDIQNMYSYSDRRGLAEYVRIAAAAARAGIAPSVPKKEPEPEIGWASAVTSVARGSVKEALEAHAKQLSEWNFDPSGGDGQMDAADQIITVTDVSGKPQRVTIRNPYRADVQADRKGGTVVPVGANADAIRMIGVDTVPGFATDTPGGVGPRHQIKVLESLWLCGSNASLQDTPACFPLRLLGEFAETMKYGSEVAAHKAAEKILGAIAPKILQDAVEKMKAVATTGAAAAVTGPAPASTAAASDGAAPAPAPAASDGAAPAPADPVPAGDAKPKVKKKSVRIKPPRKIGATGVDIPLPSGLGALGT